MMRPVVGFAGMTHLGLVSGVAAAEKGFQLVCFDPDADRIFTLRQAKPAISEPHLDELIGKNAGRILFTSDSTDLRKCDVIYIAPDVPTDDQGQSDLTSINSMLDLVFDAARIDAVVVILSQVSPGFTRLKQRQGRTLFYQVETLIFGCAIERALSPERYIVGCADPTQPLPVAFYSLLAAHDCPILPMRYESAELAKISINMCLVASISTANTLAEICEQIGADWSEIVPALKMDKRIGKYSYLAPGLGIGGGNLERDLATVCRLADEYGTDANIVRAWISNSRHRRDWVLRTLQREILVKIDDPVIAVLGLAYKQDTHSIKNSPSIALLSSLLAFRVRVFDPVVAASAAPNPRRYGASDPLDACDGADVLVIMTPWRQFCDLEADAVACRLRGKVVIDPYCVLDGSKFLEKGFEYRTLGVGTY